MEFEMNAQREAFLNARGKTILNACPGSGKTTAVAKKLALLQEEYRPIHGKFCGVACLSFTNTAKNEILEKFQEISGRSIDFPHHVSTIDSFINHFITLPFYGLLNRNYQRPRILDHTGILDKMWLVTYRDKKGKLVEGLKNPLNTFKDKNGRSIYHSYLPSKIRIEFDGTFTFDGKLPNPKIVDPTIFMKYCQCVKSTQFEKGLISTGDSAYIALYLLNKEPKIGTWLSQRFPHFIIDEAQDNSKTQHSIFEALELHGLKNIEFVGDPWQSLYEWRDADPQLFLSKYNDKKHWNGMDLTDNRRSPQRIIDCFSLLRKPTDPKINSVCIDDSGIPIIVYRYSGTNLPMIVSHFDQLCIEKKLKENQIVARGNAFTNELLGSKETQKPWGNSLVYDLIESVNFWEGKETKKAIDALRKVIISLLNPSANYHELKDIEDSLISDHGFNALLFSIFSELPKTNLSIAEWTNQTEQFFKTKLSVECEINFGLRSRNSKFFDKTCLDDTLDSHFRKAYSENRIPITTIHKVKGKSLDGILIFFNKAKHKDNITFSDVIIALAINFPNFPLEFVD